MPHCGKAVNNQGDKIYGDGINIAARIEGLDEPVRVFRVLVDPEAAGKVFRERSRFLPKHRIGMAQAAGICLWIGISVLRINPKGPAINSQAPYNYYLLAGVQLRKNEHDLAIANIRKASEMAPNSADLLSYPVKILNSLDEPTEDLSSIFSVP